MCVCMPQGLNTHTQRNKREEREKEEGTSIFDGRQKEVTNYFFSDRKELLQYLGCFFNKSQGVEEREAFSGQKDLDLSWKLKQKYLPLRPTLFFPGCAAQKAAEYI